MKEGEDHLITYHCSGIGGQPSPGGIDVASGHRTPNPFVKMLLSENSSAIPPALIATGAERSKELTPIENQVNDRNYLPELP